MADVTSYGWESGSCDLDGDDWQYDGDSETNDSDTGDVEYQCPLCGANIGTEDSWDEVEEAPVVPPSTEPQVVDDDGVIESDLYQNSERYKKVILYTCDICNTSRFLEDDEINLLAMSNGKIVGRKQTVVCSHCLTERAISVNNVSVT